jgi:hypothetical protein
VDGGADSEASVKIRNDGSIQLPEKVLHSFPKRSELAVRN